MSRDTPLVSVVATSYNNSRSLSQFVSEVRETLASRSLAFEIILIDDGSHDDSWEEIVRLSDHDNRVKGLLLSRNFGQHPAIRAGLSDARGDIVVIMDSDMDDDPSLLPELIEPIKSSTADVVLTQQMGRKRRRLTSSVFHRLARGSSTAPRVSHIGTYRAFSAVVLRALLEYRDHSTLYGPIFTSLGFKQVVVQVPDNGKARSESSYSFRKRLSLAGPVLINEVAAPMKLLIALVVFMIASVVILGVIAATRFVTDGGDATSTTSLVFLILIVNQALLGIGVLVTALYGRMTLKESLHRPRYHIARRTS